MQFKLYGTVAITVCICFVQMCQSVDDQTMKKYKEYSHLSDLNTYLNGSTAIKDIGREFTEDVQMILEKFAGNAFVTATILGLMESLATKYHGKDLKITPATVKDVHSKNDIDECSTVNTIDILQSLLLKQMPSDRINGVLNLLHVIDGNKSGKDLENALNYLYGTAERAMNPSPNLPSISSICSVSQHISGMTSFTIQVLVYNMKSLKNSTKLNPKVFEDVEIIVDTFPYNFENFYLLDIMVDLLTELNKKNSTNEICELKNQNSWFKSDYTDQEINFKAIDLEAILPTRLPVENFKDLFNLMRASQKIDGSDWKKALEYAYTSDYFKAESCK